MRNIDPSRMCITVLKIAFCPGCKANDEPTDPETPRNKDLKYDREKRTRIFQNSWIDKFLCITVLKIAF
jgi:hypothetical protein